MPMSVRAQRRLHSASDADLIALTRNGDRDAYGELWRRHADAGRAVARAYTSRFDPDDLVVEAFARILKTIDAGGGPTGAFRAYLFTTIRNTAAGWGRASAETPIDDAESIEDPRFGEDYTLAALDRSLTASAFRTLPTRWQEALWYGEVEQLTPLEMAPILGMKANAVAALMYRAREGLRQAWIQAHIRSVPADSECRWTIDRLGAHTRRALTSRNRERMDAHLAECAKCSIVASEAREVGSRIALVLLPLAAGIAGATGYAAWLQQHASTGTFATGAGAFMPAALVWKTGAAAGSTGGTSAGASASASAAAGTSAGAAAGTSAGAAAAGTSAGAAAGMSGALAGTLVGVGALAVAALVAVSVITAVNLTGQLTSNTHAAASAPPAAHRPAPKRPAGRVPHTSPSTVAPPAATTSPVVVASTVPTAPSAVAAPTATTNPVAPSPSPTGSGSSPKSGGPAPAPSPPPSSPPPPAAPAPPAIGTTDTGAASGIAGAYFPLISGTAEPGATIDIVQNGATLATAIADGSGSWTTGQLSNAAPSGTLTATQTSTTGQTSGTSDPVAYALSVPSLNVTQDSGAVTVTLENPLTSPVAITITADSESYTFVDDSDVPTMTWSAPTWLLALPGVTYQLQARYQSSSGRFGPSAETTYPASAAPGTTAGGNGGTTAG